MSRRRHYPFFANDSYCTDRRSVALCKGSNREIEILESCSSSQVFPVLFWSIIHLLTDVNVERVNLTSSVPSSTGVGLQWSPPDTEKLGEPLSGYRVEIFDLLRGERFNYTVNSSMSGANLDILKPFTPYEFKVYGFTSSWEGNITDIISLKTHEDGRF